MGDVTVEQIADDMYKMVEEVHGQKKYKPGDLTKMIMKKYGDQVTKKDCKAAIKILIDSGRCVYGYFGGSSVELPHKEGAAND